jgi:hypothetical protein
MPCNPERFERHYRASHLLLCITNARVIVPTMPKIRTCFILSLLLVSLPIVRAQAPSPASTPQAVALPAGITLPQAGTIFVLDHKEKDPQLVQLHASEIITNSQAAGNFARSLVYVGGHASIELKGLNASTNLADGHATFYVRINSDDPDVMRKRVHLIRLEQTKDRRVVAHYSQNIFGGQRKKKYNDIPIAKSDAEKDVWLKVTPQTTLAPGEYGIVFMPKDTSFWPEVVYDFDVAINSAQPEKN